ncbi:MAG: PD-(D/E)XK nuclease family protein [Planctomycetes bacterium]|nr:PD-(D/E)XK nuclease family protein [Planctomycetota bacterium]
MIAELPTREPTQRRRGGLWDYVSPSRLNVWLKCPLAFRLRYLDGIRTPTSPAAFVGKMVHSLLEQFYRHRQLGITLAGDELRRRLVRQWGQAAVDERVAFRSAAQEDACRQQVLKLAAAYVAQIPAHEPRPMLVEAELKAPLIDPVTGRDLGIPLVGVLDLVLDRGAGPVIVDFKTSSRAGRPLAVTHEVQLSSYAYLFRHVAGSPEALLEIHSLAKTKAATIGRHAYPRRSDRHFRRLFAVIHAYLDDLETGRFVMRPGWGCGGCEFRDSQCARWSGC